MKLPADIKVYGDTSYRGDCPPEGMEQVTFVNRMRRKYPDLWGRILLHPRNEGMRTHYQAMKEKAEGMTPGASDIIVPGMPAFVCEIKRRDHTKSQFQPGQEEYLRAAEKAGAFVCVALGADAASQAFEEYLAYRDKAFGQGGGGDAGHDRPGSGDHVGSAAVDPSGGVQDPEKAKRGKGRARRKAP